jgi:hypothetical protein
MGLATQPLAYHNQGHYSWFFPEMNATLMHQAFVKRRTVLVGDSTLYYLTNTLLYLMFPDQDETSEHFFKKHDPNTTINWLGFRGVNARMNCDWEHVWDLIVGRQPDIIVVNWGFHMLHAFELGRDVQLCNVDQWIHYETMFLERALQVAIESQTTRLLLFKTNNLVCGERNKYIRKTTEKIQARDETFLYKCMTALENLLKKQPQIVMYPDSLQKLKDQNPNYTQSDIHVTRQQMEEYCWNGAFEEGGSRHLHDRLIKFLHNATIPDNLTVAVFNDHDLESCLYTPQEDGRHYKELNAQRIRLLAHEINCLYPKS